MAEQQTPAFDGKASQLKRKPGESLPSQTSTPEFAPSAPEKRRRAAANAPPTLGLTPFNPNAKSEVVTALADISSKVSAAMTLQETYLWEIKKQLDELQVENTFLEVEQAVLGGQKFDLEWQKTKLEKRVFELETMLLSATAETEKRTNVVKKAEELMGSSNRVGYQGYMKVADTLRLALEAMQEPNV
ncbi:uncharacterized protein LTR77_008189 [Saxophila tyrrhenica]|uniref:Uncharacterized protein n=1 Tax=Saxophila tyrrhenica TaxID=1690608 RepID=A0AAV9P439_9PEZI|nr:hypothetical protein LTR77_008189 [Saxophila tyrrhenica]